MASVCLCQQASIEAGAVNEAKLSAAAAGLGLKVRRVAAAAADVLVCKTGSTLAFSLWRGDGGDAARLARLGASFKQAFVLVPHALLGDQAALGAAASEALTFVWLPMGADFGEAALQLAGGLLAAEAEEAAWRQQQVQTVETLEAVAAATLGLPLPQDGEAAHHSHMLRMLGSLQDISQCSAEDIAAHTSLDAPAAAAVAAFFQRGGRHAEPPRLPGLGAALPSL